MSESVNFDKREHAWDSKGEGSHHKSKKSDSLQQLLALFEETCLTGTFGQQFYILIIDPLTSRVEERSVASFSINALGVFAIFDRKNNRCYYPLTLDSASLHALETYSDDSFEMIALQPHSWEKAADHFKEHMVTLQASINDESILQFYEELARRKKEENARMEREENRKEQEVLDMSIKELAALIMKQQGKNRLAKLRALLEELHREEERREDSERKEIEEMKIIIKIEIEKEVKTCSKMKSQKTGYLLSKKKAAHRS
jgi:hypothetical protein